MRRARYTVESGHYHCMSRAINQEFLFGDIEKEYFAELLRRTEAFSGVKVLEWTILDNHFHLLVQLTPLPLLSDPEILARIEALYGRKKAMELEKEAARQKEAGVGSLVVFAPYLARMNNISEFMKTLKMRFTNWFNAVHERSGTLWGDRFKSSVVEGNHNSLLQVAAYIALNPVRARLCEDPADYRWSGYAQAVRGDKFARRRAGELFANSLQLRLNTMEGQAGWSFIGPRYRIAIYEKGRARIDRYGNTRRFGFTAEEIEKVVARGGKIDWTKLTAIQIRHYSVGVAIGSKAFVQKHILPLSRHQRFKRSRAPSEVPDKCGVFVFQTRGA